MKPPNRYTQGNSTSSNLFCDLGSSEFDEIEMLSNHCDYADQELPKNVGGALSFPEWYRASEAEYELLQKNEVWELVEMLEVKTS